MQAPSTSTITLIVLLPLIGWRFYSRFKRMVGRQRLSEVRPWLTVTLLPLLVAVLAFAAWPNADRLGLLAAGIAGGVALGAFGLSKTKFEATAEGLFYTPNAHLGIALSLLFAGRIVYRLITVMLQPGMPQASTGFTQSPLTLGLFVLLAGYYVAYAIGLLRWKSRVRSPSHPTNSVTGE